ncbi:hypothetical protein DPMN_119890 [Dreissena polymorpha]|uniref:Uncharacterized protein n=1 Tax=Dreissena polymorpha TaxID=45954 RepID=A0A9D4JSB5_DREPO|nr:hypothetical protein DPMN_119890 [Dreissena polymorpha]
MNDRQTDRPKTIYPRSFDLGCLQTKCGRTDGRRTKTNPKTSPEQSAIFQLVREINKTNVLTKFHDDEAKNVTSIVFNHKFHDDWANYVTSRVFTSSFYYIHIRKLPPPGSHVIQLSYLGNKYIIKTNVLTNFHDDWANIVTSRVFTRKTAHECLQDIIGTNLLIMFHEDRKKMWPLECLQGYMTIGHEM